MGSRNENCLFELKFCTLIYSSILHSMVMLIFPVLGWNDPIWTHLVQNNGSW